MPVKADLQSLSEERHGTECGIFDVENPSVVFNPSSSETSRELEFNIQSSLGSWYHIHNVPADIVCITCLLISQSIEMFLDLKVDGAWRRIR
jgi:hypothetical protein